MTSFDDWICENTGEVFEKFKEKYSSRIKEEYEMKFKDSYPNFDDFLTEEECYITDTLLENEWMEFVNDEHVSYISGKTDMLIDQAKDSIVPDME